MDGLSSWGFWERPDENPSMFAWSYANVQQLSSCLTGLHGAQRAFFVFEYITALTFRGTKMGPNFESYPEPKP